MGAPPTLNRPPTKGAFRSKPVRLGLGLFLTRVGLAFLVLLYPTAPGPLAHALPIAAVGMAALWVGGFLMGVGSRS